MYRLLIILFFFFSLSAHAVTEPLARDEIESHLIATYLHDTHQMDAVLAPRSKLRTWLLRDAGPYQLWAIGIVETDPNGNAVEPYHFIGGNYCLYNYNPNTYRFDLQGQYDFTADLSKKYFYLKKFVTSFNQDPGRFFHEEENREFINSKLQMLSHDPNYDNIPELYWFESQLEQLIFRFISLYTSHGSLSAQDLSIKAWCLMTLSYFSPEMLAPKEHLFDSLIEDIRTIFKKPINSETGLFYRERALLFLDSVFYRVQLHYTNYLWNKFSDEEKKASLIRLQRVIDFLRAIEADRSLPLKLQAIAEESLKKIRAKQGSHYPTSCAEFLSTSPLPIKLRAIDLN
jgi:hypothetical protein